MNKRILLLIGFLTVLCICTGNSRAVSPVPGDSSLPAENQSEEEAIAVADNDMAAQKQVTVKVRSGWVREGPSPDAAVAYGLKKGDIVSVIAPMGFWFHIETEDGKKGWVHQSLFLDADQNNLAARKQTSPESIPITQPRPQTNLAQPNIEPTHPEPANVQKTLSKAHEEGTETDRTHSVIESDNHLMCLNFVDVDIKSVLSALAMEREINISMAKDVSGKISVHLYNVSLDEGLDAITRAGGFSYNKNSNLYYVFKPQNPNDPQAERLQMHIFKLKYAEIDKIEEILEAIPGMRTIRIHEASKTIMVEDTPENIAKIKMVLGYWDKRPRQVIIEAKILEVELTDDMVFGVNWQKIMGDVWVGTGGLSSAVLPTVAPVSPVPATGTGFFGNVLTGAGTSHQFSAALDALQTQTDVNTLSTPKIVALHGETAKVQVGGQQGYKVTTVNDGVQTETIEFIDTGTILEITPYINDEDDILLYVEPSINSARIESGGIPVVKTTTVTTSLLLKNGETAFIGGLIQDTQTETLDKIPVLGSIPILGALFRRTSNTIGKSELVVLITPKILEPDSELAARGVREKTEKMEEHFKALPPRRSEAIP